MSGPTITNTTSKTITTRQVPLTLSTNVSRTFSLEIASNSFIIFYGFIRRLAKVPLSLTESIAESTINKRAA